MKISYTIICRWSWCRFLNCLSTKYDKREDGFTWLHHTICRQSHGSLRILPSCARYHHWESNCATVNPVSRYCHPSNPLTLVCDVCHTHENFFTLCKNGVKETEFVKVFIKNQYSSPIDEARVCLVKGRKFIGNRMAKTVVCTSQACSYGLKIEWDKISDEMLNRATHLQLVKILVEHNQNEFNS